MNKKNPLGTQLDATEIDMASGPEFCLGLLYWGEDTAKYIRSPHENLLRSIGKDHHSVAKIPPALVLYAPEGQAIATMDEWATEWKETGA